MGTLHIVLYTHRGCPGGDAARRYLDQRGLSYRERDVLLEAEARAEFARLGGIGTPLLLIGDRVMHGFDPSEFELLRETHTEGRHHRG